MLRKNDANWELMDTRLVELAAQDYKTTEIAEILNSEFNVELTRNAVIGRLHRIEAKRGNRLVRRHNSSNVSSHEPMPPRKRKQPYKPMPDDTNAVFNRIKELDEQPEVEELPNPLDADMPKPSVSDFPVGKPLANVVDSVAELDVATRPDGPCSIYQLNKYRCKYPLGSIKDKPPYEFCGQRAVRGSPYCDEHSRLCFTPPKLRDLKDAKKPFRR